MPSYEHRDGELVEVPDLVINESGDLHQSVKNTLVIQPGVTLNLHGRVSGTVRVEAGGTLIARNDVSGTVNVASTAQGHVLRAVEWHAARGTRWSGDAGAGLRRDGDDAH